MHLLVVLHSMEEYEYGKLHYPLATKDFSVYLFSGRVEEELIKHRQIMQLDFRI